jgi:hypothetical protein
MAVTPERPMKAWVANSEVKIAQKDGLVWRVAFSAIDISGDAPHSKVEQSMAHDLESLLVDKGFPPDFINDVKAGVRVTPVTVGQRGWS